MQMKQIWARPATSLNFLFLSPAANSHAVRVYASLALVKIVKMFHQKKVKAGKNGQLARSL